MKVAHEDLLEDHGARRGVDEDPRGGAQQVISLLRGAAGAEPVRSRARLKLSKWAR